MRSVKAAGESLNDRTGRSDAKSANPKGPRKPRCRVARVGAPAAAGDATIRNITMSRRPEGSAPAAFSVERGAALAECDRLQPGQPVATAGETCALLLAAAGRGAPESEAVSKHAEDDRERCIKWSSCSSDGLPSFPRDE